MSASTRDLPPNSLFSSSSAEPLLGGLETDLSFSLERLDDAERQVQKLFESLMREDEQQATSGVVNALQERHKREVATIKKAVAMGIVRAEESDAEERERVEEQHRQVVTDLRLRHEKEMSSLHKAAAAEVAKLQELIQAQKSLGTSAKELAELKQSKLVSTLQARFEEEIGTVREMAAKKINLLSKELSGSLQTIEMLRRENQDLQLRPRLEEFESLRQFNESLLSSIESLKLGSSCPIDGVDEKSYS